MEWSSSDFTHIVEYTVTSVIFADRTNGRAYATVLRPSVVCL